MDKGSALSPSQSSGPRGVSPVDSLQKDWPVDSLQKDSPVDADEAPAEIDHIHTG